MPITQSGGLGAAISPEQWASYVLEHLSQQSVVLASGATRVDTPNRVVHIPQVLTDGAAAWYGELEEIGPGDPTGEDLVLTPRKVAAPTKLSNEAVENSSPAVLAGERG
jgi:HK97 family phage major capsid protein